RDDLYWAWAIRLPGYWAGYIVSPRMEVDDGDYVSQMPIYARARANASSLKVRIPVYVLNALYLGPITLWTYFNYGRPNAPPQPESTSQDDHQCVSPIS